jgi:5'-nucleotidase
MKEILYIDMDGVLVDLDTQIEKKYTKSHVENHREKIIDSDKNLFYESPPIRGAIEAFNKLCEKYEVYILSTAPWKNLESWKAKRKWVEVYIGDNAYKKLILSHNKGLLNGSYIIDDRIKNGVSEFKGEHIHFGSEKFPNWNKVLEYLI